MKCELVKLLHRIQCSKPKANKSNRQNQHCCLSHGTAQGKTGNWPTGVLSPASTLHQHLVKCPKNVPGVFGVKRINHLSQPRKKNREYPVIL